MLTASYWPHAIVETEPDATLLRERLIVFERRSLNNDDGVNASSSWTKRHDEEMKKKNSTICRMKRIFSFNSLRKACITIQCAWCSQILTGAVPCATWRIHFRLAGLARYFALDRSHVSVLKPEQRPRDGYSNYSSFFCLAARVQRLWIGRYTRIIVCLWTNVLMSAVAYRRHWVTLSFVKTRVHKLWF